MSKFGSKLGALIAQSGSNKYHFSNESGVDRVMLYRFINGDRVPGTDSFEKICKALRISPTEKKELLELYDIARIGEGIYERRLLVKKLVNQINSLHMEQRPATAHKSVIVDGLEDTVKVVSGNYNVNVLVRGVLDDLAYNAQPKRIWTNAPFECAFLFDHLRQLYFETNGTIEIEHAVAFARNAGSHSNPNINLETLANVLPFVFCEGIGYRPGYYYSDSMKYDSVFMPYYLFTEKRLLLLSADCNTAMLINDASAIRACRAEFDALQTTPMFRYINSLEEILEAYLDVWTHTKNPDSIFIEAQPCIVCHTTEDMIEKCIRKELPDRDAIMQALIRHIEFGKSAKAHGYFTVDGLEDFLESGYAMYTPTQTVLPFDIADRLSLLKSFRDDAASGESEAYAINPAEISVALNTSVSLFTNSMLLFAILNESGMRMCVIDEPSIYDAFYDFLQNLHDTKCVYSKQETLDILDKYIEKAEQAAAGGLSPAAQF